MLQQKNLQMQPQMKESIIAACQLVWYGMAEQFLASAWKRAMDVVFTYKCGLDEGLRCLLSSNTRIYRYRYELEILNGKRWN